VASAGEELGLPRHTLTFTEKVTLRQFGAISRVTDKISDLLKARLNKQTPVEVLSETEVSIDSGRVSVTVAPIPKSQTEKEVSVTWGMEVCCTFE